MIEVAAELYVFVLISTILVIFIVICWRLYKAESEAMEAFLQRDSLARRMEPTIHATNYLCHAAHKITEPSMWQSIARYVEKTMHLRRKLTSDEWKITELQAREATLLAQIAELERVLLEKDNRDVILLSWLEKAIATQGKSLSHNRRGFVLRCYSDFEGSVHRTLREAIEADIQQSYKALKQP